MGIRVYRDRFGVRDYVGRIGSGVPRESSVFTYDSDYALRSRAGGELGISELLPIDVSPYTQSEFGPFFQGFLPEGEVYGNLARLYQVPRMSYLSLLEQMGCESIGALTFVSEDVDEAEYVPRYEPVGPAELDAMIEDPARMATMVARSTRLSLAGAQSKVAWFLPSGVSALEADASDWLVPRGTAPSTHIVKISRRGEEEIALNEFVCSLLAKACGIETVKVLPLSDVPGSIVVERYDRRRVQSDSTNYTLRLHQEDFCQALGLSPHFKYQPSGVGANYPAMMADLVESTSANPQADKVELAKRLVFCYVVGNTDAHLKNFSLLYNEEWTSRRLAPLYDVTCIPLTGYSMEMPFDFGDHRTLEGVDERDLCTVAADMNIGFESFDAVVREVLQGIESPGIEGVAPDADRYVDMVLECCKPRLQVLRSFLG